MKSKKMTAREFLIRHIAGGEKYAEITNATTTLDQLRSWYKDEQFDELRTIIRRSNQLYNGKHKNEKFDEFKKLGKVQFFKWFEKQFKEQNGSCAYCKIEESKLNEIFDKKIIFTKRRRGRVLELERKDAKNNLYTKKNCVLSCYLCNNHKSDMISEKDHLKYFAAQIKGYLEAKYLEAQSKKALKRS